MSTTTPHISSHKPLASVKGFTFTKRKLFEWGGIAASVILVGFGIASIVTGLNGRDTVSSSLTQQHIVGSPDMTPAAITAEAKKARLNVNTIPLPTKSVANQPVNSGDRARTFAQYMNIHTLEATGGFTYAQMGRFEAKPNAPKSQLAVGGGTDNPSFAVMDPKTQQPAANGQRDIWVTETALTNALNMSYMAERLSLFGVMVGVALLLAGIGFSVLTIGGALKRK
jgi:hypothetical protein